MMTGADKADVFAVLRKHHAGPAVFIGDSPHDLPSLLDADLGIVIGRHEVMIQLCADLDIALVPTTQWTPRSGDAPPALLAVESWREIHDLLFECGLACWHAVPGKEDRADASPL